MRVSIMKQWWHRGPSGPGSPHRRWPTTPRRHGLGLIDRDGSPLAALACLVFLVLAVVFISAAAGAMPSTTEFGAVLWAGCALEGLLLALTLRANTESNPPSPAGPDPSRHQTVDQQALRRNKELESVIERLRARQLQLETQANHDCLTGLANRRLLQDRFECAVERARRSRQGFALLMVDLDGFKAVNDTHGHGAGDTVLKTVAQRMVATLRTCDTVARLGGDEFVLIIESIHDPAEIIPIGRKLVQTLLQTIRLANGASVSIGASVGMALYPNDGTDLAHMLDVADSAMYECKSSGQISLQPSAT